MDPLKPITIQTKDGDQQVVDPAAMFQLLSVSDPAKPITYYDADGQPQRATAGAFKTAIANRVQGAAPPAPPLPAGLVGPSAVDTAKQQMGQERANAAHDAAYGARHAVAPASTAIGGMPGAAPLGGSLDDLWAGLRAMAGTNDPEQKAIAQGAVYQGGKQAGRLASAAAISGYHAAAAGGPEAAIPAALTSIVMGNDSPLTTAAFGFGGKILPAVSKIPGLSPTLGGMLPDAAGVATRPGTGRLVGGLAGLAAGNVASKVENDQYLPWWANAIGGIASGVDGGVTGYRNMAASRSPATQTERILRALEQQTGMSRDQFMGGKATRTQFSPVNTPPPPISGVNMSGAATMAPGVPSLAMPNMQDVVDQLKDIAGTTAKGVRAGAQAVGSVAGPMASAMADNPSTAQAALVTLAKKLGKKAPQAVNPADVAPGQPQPPKKDDKLAKDEALVDQAGGSGSAMAGPGGALPPLGPGGLPQNAPGSGVVARPGSMADIRIPESTVRYPAQYKLRELKELIASHDPNSFNYDARYPFENERDYSIKGANQDHVVLNSQPGKLEPGDLVNTNNQATSGPPIVTPEGHVMGGNGRTMILKRAVRNADDAARYRAYLKANAHTFGLDPADVDKFESPVVVRELTDAPKSIKANAQNIIADLNVDPQKAKSLEEQAIADAKRLRPEHWDTLNALIEDAPEDKSIRAVLDDPKYGRRILDNLTEGTVDDANGQKVVTRPGVFRQGEMNKLTTDQGGISGAAKDRIENMMIARFFDNPKQMANTPAAVKDKLARAAGTMARLANYPEWDVAHMMPDAIRALEEGRVHGFTNLNLMNKQPDFSGRVFQYDDPTLAIADTMRARGSVAFNNTLKGYLKDAEIANGKATAHMFDAPRNLEDAFGETFGVKGLKPTPAPQRAASVIPEEAPAAAPPPPSKPTGQQPPPPEPAAAPAAPEGEAHPLVAAAKRLNEAMGRKVKGAVPGKLADALATAHTDPKLGDLAEQHAMIDAARQITPEEFEAMSEFASRQSRNGWTTASRTAAADYLKAKDPEQWAKVKDAWDSVAAKLGIMPEEAEDFGNALAQIRAKVAGETNWQKMAHGRAREKSLSEALDVAEKATQHPNSIPTQTAPPPPQQGPQPQSQPFDMSDFAGKPSARGNAAKAKADQSSYWEAKRHFDVNQPPQGPSEPYPAPKNPLKGRVDPKTGKVVLDQPEAGPPFEEFVKNKRVPATPTPNQAPSAAYQAAQQTEMQRAAQQRAAAKLGQFLQTIYDRGTGSFDAKAAEKFAEWKAGLQPHERELIETATGKPAMELQKAMDKQSTVWAKAKRSTYRENDDLMRGRIGLPIGKIVGLPGVRANFDIMNPLARRSNAIMADPNGPAAQAMRQLVANPDTPKAFVQRIIERLFGSGDDK